MLGTLSVNNIMCYAYHGCMKEESIVGTFFSICVELEADFSKPSTSDNLKHTIDYASVCKLVQDEMKIRSNLIEHVCKRILDKLISRFPKILFVKVKLTKHNPPISGEVNNVEITICSKRL